MVVHAKKPKKTLFIIFSEFSNFQSFLENEACQKDILWISCMFMLPKYDVWPDVMPYEIVLRFEDHFKFLLEASQSSRELCMDDAF